MKKCLYILFVIDVLAIACGFITMLTASVIYAIVFLALGFLQLVPIIAIIYCLNNIEDHIYKISQLYLKFHRLEEIKDNNDNDNPPIAEFGEKSNLPWKCIKCDTVNKAGATNCSNCGAKFIPEINPVFEPTPKGFKGFLLKFKK